MAHRQRHGVVSKHYNITIFVLIFDIYTFGFNLPFGCHPIADLYFELGCR